MILAGVMSASMVRKLKHLTWINLHLKELSWTIIMCNRFVHPQEVLSYLADIQYTQVCLFDLFLCVMQSSDEVSYEKRILQIEKIVIQRVDDLLLNLMISSIYEH